MIEGITGDWQRFQVPLRWMNGIKDWTHLRQLALVLQPRRSPALQGAYWLNDLALVKTGQPGPSIDDRIVPPKKTAWETALGGKDASSSAWPSLTAKPWR